MTHSLIYSREGAPDFGRDVHCIFGLPIDAIDERSALDLVRASCATRSRLLLSTPNVSFATSSLKSDAFRASVVNSDLCTADGAPIIGLARLLGAPVKTRVTGSTLFSRLISEPPPAISVYFFGGAEGVAEQAALRLNDCGFPGVKVVGHATPPFGDVESMSDDAFIDPINAAKPDFVVVALGAQKGQEWIVRNWSRLEAPVISHLGAVVNFCAGTVQRAPVWVQRLSLEWLWRIKEEPYLWRRYVSDGKGLFRFLCLQALPWFIFNREQRAGSGLGVELHETSGSCRLVLNGCADNGPGLAWFRSCLTEACVRGATVTLDMSDVSRVGTAFVGLVQLLDAWHRPRSGLGVLDKVSPSVARAIRWAGAGYLLDPGAALDRSEKGPDGGRDGHVAKDPALALDSKLQAPTSPLLPDEAPPRKEAA